jgi:hypothetical protein
MRRTHFVAFVATCAALLVSKVAFAQSKGSEQKFPDVIDVKIKSLGNERFDFDVTLSSPYDTPQRYCDAFKVMDSQGKLLGERVLLHDHQTEQPFTRDLHGIVIPVAVRAVTVQGRDLKFGYGGKSLQIALPGR